MDYCRWRAAEAARRYQATQSPQALRWMALWLQWDNTDEGHYLPVFDSAQSEAAWHAGQRTHPPMRVAAAQKKYRTLYYVRHGQSVANAGGITMDDPVIPLSALGQAQAQAVAGLLPKKPARIISSPYLRARQTAQPYAQQTGCEPDIRPDIHEFKTFDHRLLEGMTGQQRRPIADAYWQQADVHKVMGEQAESFLDFQHRVTLFGASLHQYPDRTVIFGHGMFLGLVIWNHLGFFQLDPTGMRAFRAFQLALPMPNCVIYRLHLIDEALARIEADNPAIARMAAFNRAHAAPPQATAACPPAGKPARARWRGFFYAAR